MGFVPILLITLRLDFTHTRLNGLRAVNSNLSAVVLSVSLPLCLSVWFACPVSVAGAARRVGGCLCFVFGSLDSSPSRPLSIWPAACLSLSLCLCVCVLAPRVSRPIVTLTCSDHVQLSPPVDLCVRELSPPLSMLSRGLWHAGENLLPSCHAR